LAKAHYRLKIVAHTSTTETFFKVRIECRLIFAAQGAIKKIAD
jgi:hypothetical protein